VLRAPGFGALKYDSLLSIFAFNSKLRRYIKGVADTLNRGYLLDPGYHVLGEALFCQ
jgi:hypothetical protein